MNEFIAKKLGEVLAFSRIGLELFDRGAAGLEQVFTESDRAEITKTLQAQANEIEALADEHDVTEITAAKAGKTVEKLRGMMETYIGDEWDNSAELLEWMGFYGGAAVVHWKLMEGVAQALDDDSLRRLADAGATSHHNLFHNVQEAITEIGRSKTEA